MSDMVLPPPPDEHHPTDSLLSAGLVAGTGAIVGPIVLRQAGVTAIGALGVGVGWGSAAGPVGAVGGAIVGLAAYGVGRAIGSMFTGGDATTRWYAHLNALRDAAPETGPAQMFCRHCGALLWPRWDGAPYRTWVDSEEGTHCEGRRHDAHPLAWAPSD